MGKQAVGIHCTSYNKRYDTFSHVLSYPQKPIIDTKMMKYLNIDKLPNGINVIVAIATYAGYNQEDSIILNKNSVDRGLFSASVFNTYKDEDKNIQGDQEIRCKPDVLKTKGIKFANYKKLNDSCLLTLINFAGLPTTMAFLPTFLVTTAPAPTKAPSEILILGSIVAFVPIVTKFPILTRPAKLAPPMI